MVADPLELTSDHSVPIPHPVPTPTADVEVPYSNVEHLDVLGWRATGNQAIYRTGSDSNSTSDSDSSNRFNGNNMSGGVSNCDTNLVSQIW